MAERGRPSIFSEELATRICERLAAGETLRAVCRDDDMPSESTVRRWASDTEHPISAQYVRAREIGYQCMADEIIEIADGSDGDARLRVDTRKWLMSKALPKMYGDKVSHEVGGPGGGPVQFIELIAVKPDAAAD
jgi:hypothetical protein